MPREIGYKGNDILENKLEGFDAFVKAINEFGRDQDPLLRRDIDFDMLGGIIFFEDLVLDSIARNIAVPDKSSYDVRVTTCNNYSCFINIWTRKAKVPEEKKYGLESNIYLLSFPIGINHHRLIELEDQELFYANIKRERLGSLGECIRGIRIMRFIENIQDYGATITEVKRGIEQVKKAYDQVSSQKG